MRSVLALSMASTFFLATTAWAVEDWEPAIGHGTFLEVGGAANSVTGDLAPIISTTGYQVGGAVGFMSRYDRWNLGVDVDVYYYDPTDLADLNGVSILTHARGGPVIAERFQPYGKVGIGLLYLSAGGLSGTNLAISAGGGARLYLAGGLYCFFDADWVSEVVDGPAYSQVRYGGGLGVTF